MRAAALAAALLALLGAASARAEPEAAARAEARRLAEQGDAAFAEGRCDRAVPLWIEAGARFEAPTILLRIARCQVLLGRVVAAAATLERIGALPLDPGAPPAFADAQADARGELPAVRARIARLELAITADPAIDARVEIDESPGRPDARAFALDPGRHRVRVRAGDDGVVWERSLTLGDGETQRLAVTLRAEPPPPPPRPTRRAGLVIGGAGAISLAVGAGFAFSALVIARRLDAVCGPDRRACPPAEEDTIDRLRTHALVADLALTGGAALAGAGALLLLGEPRPAPEHPRIRVGVLVGPSPASPGVRFSLGGEY